MAASMFFCGSGGQAGRPVATSQTTTGGGRFLSPGGTWRPPAVPRQHHSTVLEQRHIGQRGSDREARRRFPCPARFPRTGGPVAATVGQRRTVNGWAGEADAPIRVLRSPGGRDRHRADCHTWIPSRWRTNRARRPTCPEGMPTAAIAEEGKSRRVGVGRAGWPAGRSTALGRAVADIRKPALPSPTRSSVPSGLKATDLRSGVGVEMGTSRDRPVAISTSRTAFREAISPRLAVRAEGGRPHEADIERAADCLPGRIPDEQRSVPGGGDEPLAVGGPGRDFHRAPVPQRSPQETTAGHVPAARPAGTILGFLLAAGGGQQGFAVG